MNRFLILVLCSACSAVVGPDPSLLGGGPDGGPGTDAGPGGDAGPGQDSGPPVGDAGTDTPPPFDAGPGCEDREPRCEGNTLTYCVDGMDVGEICVDGTVCDEASLSCIPVPMECPDAPPICMGDTSFQCLGESNRSPVDCPLGCDERTGLCGDGRYVPSNLGRDAFDDGAPPLDVVGSGTVEYNTDLCDLMNGGARIRPMNDGSEACVWTVSGFSLPEAVTVKVIGSLPLIVISTGDVTIDGTLDLSAIGDSPGPGGSFGGVPGIPSGDGDGGGAAGTDGGRRDGGGGGAGGLSMGGTGGSAGEDEITRGGEGGPALMVSGEPLRGGGGGGMGPGAEGREGRGGAGGGAIQISSLGTVDIRGTIRSGGGGGRGGIPSGGDWAAGGGGGAGGTILFEGLRVRLRGNISVAGGGGGGGVNSFATSDNDGEDGPLEGVAQGSERGVNGGNGGGEQPTDGETTRSSTGNGGGGGGSAGHVVVRSSDIELEGSLNPGVTPTMRAL